MVIIINMLPWLSALLDCELLYRSWFCHSTWSMVPNKFLLIINYTNNVPSENWEGQINSWSTEWAPWRKIKPPVREKGDFAGGAVVKNPPAIAGDTRDAGLIPGSGRSPREGNGNPFQYSCLENSMDRRVWQATVHEAAKSRTWLSDWAPMREKEAGMEGGGCCFTTAGREDR